MGSILIRNLEDDVIDALKARAKGKGRSLQAELQAELTRLAREDRRAAAIETARRIRESVDVSKLDKPLWQMIREDRDR